MNKIEITVLSARVLDALSGRGLKAKTVHEFERYGTRRIVKHCLGKGQILYSKETVQNFVWQERAKQESGTLPHYQWGITRRAAVYLDQMAEYGKIQDEPIRPWEAEHNPLFQAISCNPSNSMKVIDIICRTRDAVMQLELSDKTKTNYIYCGFGAILNFFISRGEESYSPETLALFVKTVQENFVNGAIQKASFQTMRKAAHWIEEYLSTGQVSQQKLRKYNFACAPPEFENLLSQYQLYMDNISPHVLRHTKAMHLLRAGVNMIYIRDFLGHADISTTEVYARIDAEMKRKVFEEKVPNYTPNTTMPWEEDEDLLQWLTQFGKKTF